MLPYPLVCEQIPCQHILLGLIAARAIGQSEENDLSLLLGLSEGCDLSLLLGQSEEDDLGLLPDQVRHAVLFCWLHMALVDQREMSLA